MYAEPPPPCSGLHATVPLSGPKDRPTLALHKPLVDAIIANRMLAAAVATCAREARCPVGEVATLCLGDLNSKPGSPAYQVRRHGGTCA